MHTCLHATNSQYNAAACSYRAESAVAEKNHRISSNSAPLLFLDSTDAQIYLPTRPSPLTQCFIIRHHKSTIAIFHQTQEKWGLASFYTRKQLLLSARLSHRNSVCPSVPLSVCHTGESITKFSPSAIWKPLVLGTVKSFHKFEGIHPERRR